MSNVEIIDINDVAKIFNFSIETIRKYKSHGLFESCKRVGRKDFYDSEEIHRRKDIIQYYKQKRMKLSEIAKKISELKEQKNFEKDLKNADAKKILIIEDREGLVRILKAYLEKGFPENELNIFVANDGSMGIELALSMKPDLIILDVTLPVFDGKEVHRRLKNHPHTHNAKFITMSGNVIFEPEEAIFLEKPFKPDQFIKAVKTLFEEKTD